MRWDFLILIMQQEFYKNKSKKVRLEIREVNEEFNVLAIVLAASNS